MSGTFKDVVKIWGIVVGIIAALVLMLSVLTACSGDNTNSDSMIAKSENNSRFILIEKIGDDKNYDAIYVDKKTGVEYFVHREKDTNNGHIAEWGTVLFGADGLPLLADGYTR